MIPQQPGSLSSMRACVLAKGALLIALTVLLIAAEAVGAPVLKVWAGLLGMGYLFCVARNNFV